MEFDNLMVSLRKNNAVRFSDSMLETDTFQKFLDSFKDSDGVLYLWNGTLEDCNMVKDYFSPFSNNNSVKYMVNRQVIKLTNEYMMLIQKEALDEVVRNNSKYASILMNVEEFYKILFDASDEWFDTVTFKSFFATLIDSDEDMLYGMFHTRMVSKKVCLLFKANSLNSMLKKYINILKNRRVNESLDNVFDIEEVLNYILTSYYKVLKDGSVFEITNDNDGAINLLRYMIRVYTNILRCRNVMSNDDVDGALINYIDWLGNSIENELESNYEKHYVRKKG